MSEVKKAYPGFNRGFDTSKFNSDEIAILNVFAKKWFLTVSKEISINNGQSKYRYVLLQPTQDMEEMFNLGREIVCLFSEYEKLEIRTLAVFDKIAEEHHAHRIESSCGILISKAADSETIVSSLLKSDPEHRIIIPFEYKEFTLSKPISLENRIQKHFFSRDLFAFLSPLKKDTYFFGRGQIINELISKHESGEHSSLFGLRKSGKTSIVYAIERRLLKAKGIVVSLDCESPSVHQKKWYELLELLVVEYKKQTKSKVNIKFENRYLEKNAADSFEQDMLKIYQSRKNKRALFIFDEIERLTPGTASSSQWREGIDFIYFWQTMRAFFQKYPEVMTYMLVGTNPNCVESPKLCEHENPIFASIESQYIPNFEVGQVSEMINTLGRYMGLSFDGYIAPKLVEDFGGHPFLIRQICSLMSDMAKDRPASIDKSIYLQAKENFFERSESYLSMMIQVLKDNYVDEYDMLVYLANGNISEFNELAQTHQAYTKHLVGYGIIKKGSSNGVAYTFRLEVIAELLKRANKYSKINLTIEEKLAEISERRNALEISLRKLLKQYLRTHYGLAQAVEKSLNSIEKPRREKLVGFDLNALFGSNSPLFFNDLKQILSREWAIFLPSFHLKKEEMEFYLGKINEGRSDAHAKDMNNDDFDLLRSSFKKIEEQISDVLF